MKDLRNKVTALMAMLHRSASQGDEALAAPARRKGMLLDRRAAILHRDVFRGGGGTARIRERHAMPLRRVVSSEVAAAVASLDEAAEAETCTIRQDWSPHYWWARTGQPNQILPPPLPSLLEADGYLYFIPSALCFILAFPRLSPNLNPSGDRSSLQPHPRRRRQEGGALLRRAESSRRQHGRALREGREARQDRKRPRTLSRIKNTRRDIDLLMATPPPPPVRPGEGAAASALTSLSSWLAWVKVSNAAPTSGSPRRRSGSARGEEVAPLRQPPPRQGLWICDSSATTTMMSHPSFRFLSVSGREVAWIRVKTASRSSTCPLRQQTPSARKITPSASNDSWKTLGASPRFVR
uniref:Uncharacterized protein n=1 Tax=Oryza nivara TaxID=4536 RepID=A0A0E0J3J0_ORYNI